MDRKILAIIGAGQLGMQIAHFAISDNHFTNIIFFDDYTNLSTIEGFEVQGKLNTIKSAYLNNEFDELFVGIGYKHMDLRKKIFNNYKGLIPFANIVHSTAIIDDSIIMGEGNIIYPGCILDANVELKDNILINIGCSIAHDSKIASHCFLSPRVSLAGFVQIGEQSNLGINTVVIDNLNLSANLQTGGGTVVIKHLAVPGLYVGNPSRLIK